MLKIIKRMKDVNVSQLLSVCSDSIQTNGEQDYPRESANLQILSAERDFLDYLRLFLLDDDSCCAVWEPHGAYVATLRLERYNDGFIITSLETSPDARRKGYGCALVRAVLEWLSAKGVRKVYSHIDKHNIASINLHLSCGFERILEYAVYVDGSVLYRSCTMCICLNKKTAP